jgi:hypothetical protein
MKSETWKMFGFFNDIIRKDQFYINSLLNEFEHDSYYNKNTRQLEIEHMLNDDYDCTQSAEIVTFEKFITERITDEINLLNTNIEKEYFSIDTLTGKKAFISTVIGKVVHLIKECNGHKDPYSRLFSEHLQPLLSFLIDRYEDEAKASLEQGSDNIQGKNQKIHVNLTRDQLGALLYLLQESEIIDAKVKPSLLARVIEANVLILDVSHNYRPVKQLDVLMSQLKNDDKDYKNILSEIILKFKTSSAYNS